MKKFLFLILLFGILSCNGVKEKKCDIACLDYQECISGKCELKENMCTQDEDCKNDLICNKSRHKCVKDVYKCSLNNLSGKCQENASCVEGTCKCNEDYQDNNGVCELKEEAKCSMTNTDGKCQENASCVEGICKCNNGYKPGENNTCTIGNCDECTLCQECIDGECVDKNDGYLCNGGFNSRCRPRLSPQDTRKSGCLGNLMCIPDPEEPQKAGGYPISPNALGYCSDYCRNGNDNTCISQNYQGRKDDKFMCLAYTSTYMICEKLKSVCEYKDYRQGELGDSCIESELTCRVDSYCKEGLLCIAGVCSEECRPQNDSCGEGRICSSNLWKYENDPMHRCVDKCENDNSCGDRFCNSWFIAKESKLSNKEYSVMYCSVPKGEKKYNEVCKKSKETPYSQRCESGLCLGKGENGVCGKICSSSKDCGEDKFCMFAPLFSDSEAGLSLCVDDSWIKNKGYKYKGDCDEGCSEGSSCQVIELTNVPKSNKDINYLCFESINNTNKKGLSELCDDSSQCESGFCFDSNSDGSKECTALCKINENCPNGKTCSGKENYYENNLFPVQYNYCK